MMMVMVMLFSVPQVNVFWSLAGRNNSMRSQPRMQNKLVKPPKPHPSDLHKWHSKPKERDTLKIGLELLPIYKVEQVAKILKSQQNMPQNLAIVLEHCDEIMIELANLDYDMLWELDRFVTNHKENQGKKNIIRKTNLKTKSIDILLKTH